jgi:hypothetical protein
MISQDDIIAVLKALHVERARDFILVFKVTNRAGTTDLKPYVIAACPERRKEIEAYALVCRGSVLECYQNAHNLIDDKSPYGPANELGQRWWLFVLATGATRSAGLVIVGRVAAVDATDVENYMRKIDSALLKD